MKKTILTLFLSIIISLSSINVYGDKIDDTQNKLNEVNNSIKSNGQKLDEINQKAEKTKNEIDSIDKSMSEASNNLKELNKQINTINNKINESNEKLTNEEKKLNTEKEMYGKRVKAMYMYGNYNYFEVVINSKSFSQLIERIQVIKKIIDYDNDLVDSINNDLKKVKNIKDELEVKKNEYALIKKKSDSTYNELQLKSTEKSKIMTALIKDKSQYENMIKEEQEESKDIQLMIAQIKKSMEEANKKNPVITSSGGLCCITGRPFYITSPFGYRMHPVLHRNIFHSGIDIGVPFGTPIYDLKDGTVIYAGPMSGYGNVIMINHGNIISLYAHLSSICVTNGQAVKKSSLIAYSGNSGMSTGPHLHFEIRTSDGNTINPAPYYIK